MNLYTTLAKQMRVGISKNVANMNSNVTDGHIGKIYTITGWDTNGREHNKYISCVHLQDADGNRVRAVVSELATLNPHYEPEGNFLVCVGCGATISELDLKMNKHLRNIKSCPACGMLEPHES